MPSGEMKKKLKNFFRASSMRTVVLGFGCIILIGAFFLCLPISHKDGQWFPFIDALFTSTSAVCVTGLIVVDTAAEYSLFGQIVIMLLIQIGGLGFMTGAMLVFLILGKRITLQQRLLVKESFGEFKLQGLVVLIKKILLYTLVIEGVGAVLLMFAFVPELGWGRGIFTSLFTSVSAFCNAGFDVLGEGEFVGLTPYASNVLVCLPIMLLIVTGGLGFSVLMEIVGIRNTRRVSMHARVVLGVTSALILIGAVLFMIFEWNRAFAHLDTGSKILAGFFQSITPRTAGFNTVDQSTLSEPSRILTVVLMFIGASPASTGGGIKTTTFMILVLCVSSLLTSKKNVNIGKERIAEDTIRKALAIVTLALSTIIISAMLISIFELNNAHHELMTTGNVLFECFSAFSTVGLSAGITPYISNPSKIVLNFVMFIGRVGPLTMGVALAKKSNKQDNIIFPDAKIMVG